MNELIPYLMQRLQQGGSTAVARPGTALERLILHGEVQPPPRETNGKPATRFGPIIDGEAIRGIPGGGGGAPPVGGGGMASRLFGGTGGLGAMANPLMAAIMGSIQGDVLNNHTPRTYYTKSPNDQVAARFGGMQPPAPQPQMEDMQWPVGPNGLPPDANAQVAARFGGMQPPAGASFAERFGGMDPAVLAKGDMLHADPNQRVAQNFPPQMAASVPMPQPRPQMAQAPVPMPMARPAEAPSPMGFFQRNAAMMTDPVTGGFIDPQAAGQAGNGGIIQKMLGLLHNKANNA